MGVGRFTAPQRIHEFEAVRLFLLHDNPALSVGEHPIAVSVLA